MAADELWKTQNFRQSVLKKIDEAIQLSGMTTSRKSSEMENHIFLKAKTKEEYLGFIARLILHFKENTKKGATGTASGSGGGDNNQGMPDPIGAPQTLAQQGTGNNQMMGMAGPGPNHQNIIPQQPVNNLLQSLNQQPGQPVNIPGMQNKMQGMGMMPTQTGGPINHINQIQTMQNNSMLTQINQIKSENISQQMNQMVQGQMAADESWKTENSRQSVLTKIDEAIQLVLFLKATTKEDYLHFITRLILRIRESINTKKDATDNASGTDSDNNQGMSDLINALQTLARQGTRNNEMKDIADLGHRNIIPQQPNRSRSGSVTSRNSSISESENESGNEGYNRITSWLEEKINPEKEKKKRKAESSEHGEKKPEKKSKLQVEGNMNTNRQETLTVIKMIQEMKEKQDIRDEEERKRWENLDQKLEKIEADNNEMRKMIRDLEAKTNKK